MKKTFTHTFDKEADNGVLSNNTNARNPAKIKMKIDSEGGFWMSANREGWLHFAKICVELGLGDYEDGYHFHQDHRFQSSDGPPEFSFVVDHDPDED